jgi:hypothetical protein
MGEYEDVLRVFIRLIATIVVSFVALPLLLILGVNLIVSAAGVTAIPLTLSSYAGAVFVRVALLARIGDGRD